MRIWDMPMFYINAERNNLMNESTINKTISVYDDPGEMISTKFHDNGLIFWETETFWAIP